MEEGTIVSALCRAIRLLLSQHFVNTCLSRQDKLVLRIIFKIRLTYPGKEGMDRKLILLPSFLEEKLASQFIDCLKKYQYYSTHSIYIR